MKTTAFTKYHIAAGAKMAEFAGYNMPVSYTHLWLVGSKLLSGYGYYKSCNTDLQKLGDRGGFVLATGISSTYLASRNFGIRFSTDYDMAPPFAKDSRQRLHMLTFSLEMCIRDRYCCSLPYGSMRRRGNSP